jgi:hypothetical protein
MRCTWARALARATWAPLLTASSAWEPAAFVDLCAAACAGQNQATELCRKIQARE